MLKIFQKSEDFHQYFEQMGSNLHAASDLLLKMLSDVPNAEPYLDQLHNLEHLGDDLVHNTLKKLSLTFITPFDREDIYYLCKSIDDVLDFIYAVGSRLVLYKLSHLLPEAGDLANLLHDQTGQLQDAIINLRNFDQVLVNCDRVDALEKNCDTVYRSGLGTLFVDSMAAVEIIKQKDVLDMLENATDKCADVADALETIVLKHA